MSFPIVQDCRPGHGGEPVSDVLHFALAGVALKARVDSWAARGYRDFRLPGEDGATCIVRDDLRSGLWQLTLYGRGPEAG